MLTNSKKFIDLETTILKKVHKFWKNEKEFINFEKEFIEFEESSSYLEKSSLIWKKFIGFYKMWKRQITDFEKNIIFMKMNLKNEKKEN